MRVVIVALSVNGAMGQYAHCLCTALAQTEEVIFAAPNHFQYHPENYEWIKLKTGTNRLAAASRLLNPIAGSRMWRDVIRIKPAAIHFLNGESYPWALIGIPHLKRVRVPFICTIHDAQAHSQDLFGKISEFLRIPALRSAAKIHVHTEDAKRLLKMDPERVRVIPLGSFAPLFTKYSRPGIQREKSVLFFGRIAHYKGVDVLLKAKAHLDPSWKFIIAGPGVVTPEITRLINGSSNVELINRYLSDAEVAHLFQRATVCALPYRDATQSSAPLISAAFGVPVVASAVGGFREDVPKVNGILTPPGDVAALATAIENALTTRPIAPANLEFASLKEDFMRLYRDAISTTL
jgi:glycosyltransferase involved in cell wall biosynthesis